MSPQPQPVTIAAYAPGIFQLASSQGAIVDASYHVVDSSHPAIAGTTYITIYCTGLGSVSNQTATGAAAPSSPLARTTGNPTVYIGGQPVTNIYYSGLTPGYVGLYQVNLQVLTGLTSNSATPVYIDMMGTRSNSVTIAVQ